MTEHVTIDLAQNPRLVIAEDHTLVREGLRQLLRAHFQVLDAVADGRALLELATRLRPDVLLMDIAMPGLNGLEAARQLGRLCPESRVIFVTQHLEPAYAREAFRAGGRGYVVKHSAFAELLVAIREVIAGRRYLSAALLPERGVIFGDEPPYASSPWGALTPRQREVLQLVGEGHTAREIAAVLQISRKTAEFHKLSIMHTLGLQSTAELTRYALQHGVCGI